MIRRRHGVLLAALIGVWPAMCSAQADTSKAVRTRSALESWLTARAGPEHVTGVAAYVSFGDSTSPTEAFAGRVGAKPGSPLVKPYDIVPDGQDVKSFAVAILLKLEAEGGFRSMTYWEMATAIPIWKDVTLRRPLNMTSGIRNYSETEVVSRIWINERDRNVIEAELVDLAYSKGKSDDCRRYRNLMRAGSAIRTRFMQRSMSWLSIR